MNLVELFDWPTRIVTAPPLPTLGYDGGRMAYPGVFPHVEGSF